VEVKMTKANKETITPDLFRTVGKSTEKMEIISRPSLTFWQESWLRIRKDKAAFIGLIILTLYVILAIFAPMLSQYEFDPARRLRDETDFFSGALDLVVL